MYSFGAQTVVGNIDNLNLGACHVDYEAVDQSFVFKPSVTCTSLPYTCGQVPWPGMLPEGFMLPGDLPRERAGRLVSLSTADKHGRKVRQLALNSHE